MSFEHEDNSSSETESEMLNHTIEHNNDVDCVNNGNDAEDEDDSSSNIENDISMTYEEFHDDTEDDNSDVDDDDDDEDDDNNVNGECAVEENGSCGDETIANIIEDDSSSEDDSEEDSPDLLDVKPRNLQISHSSSLHDITRIHWSPGSWQDGTRKSAFQPYRPTTLVLTNLQRGNIPTESSVPEQTDVSFHHRSGQGEINEQDIEQESDVDLKDSNGLSALMWASAYGQVPTVQLLIQQGAQVDLEGLEGETSLLLAAAGGHHEVVRHLLTEGAAVNHADEIGNTALMYAAHGDHPHCSNELLLRGADVTMKNLNGDSAYGIAVKRRSKLAQAVMENYLLTLLS